MAIVGAHSSKALLVDQSQPSQMRAHHYIPTYPASLTHFSGVLIINCLKQDAPESEGGGTVNNDTRTNWH